MTPDSNDACAAGLARRRWDSPYLTLVEAAAYCRRSTKTLCNHKADGRLRAVSRTRPTLFRVEDLDAWLAGRNRR